MAAAISFEDYMGMFEKCLELVERVPVEHKSELILISESLLERATECIAHLPPFALDQTRPTTAVLH